MARINGVLGLLVIASLVFDDSGYAQPPHRAPPKPADSARDRALIAHVRARRSDLVEVALDNGARATAKDSDGTDAITLALGPPIDASTVTVLLINGAPRVPELPSLLPELLFDSAAKDKVDRVTKLCVLGASMSMSYNGFTILHVAGPLVTDWALAHGADANARDAEGKLTPIMSTVSSDYLLRAAKLEKVRLLLRAGAKINAALADGRTALHMTPHDIAMVRALLDLGADPLAMDHGVRLMAGLTAELPYGDDEYGGKPDEIKYDRGHRIPSPALAAAGLRVFESVLEDLLHRGIDVDARGPGGRTSLYAAPAAVAKVLLRHGANPNVADVEGMTPLMVAASDADAEKVSLLLAHHADPKVEDKRGHDAAYFALVRRRDGSELQQEASQKTASILVDACGGSLSDAALIQLGKEPHKARRLILTAFALLFVFSPLLFPVVTLLSVLLRASLRRSAFGRALAVGSGLTTIGVVLLYVWASEPLGRASWAAGGLIPLFLIYAWAIVPVAMSVFTAVAWLVTRLVSSRAQR